MHPAAGGKYRYCRSTFLDAPARTSSFGITSMKSSPTPTSKKSLSGIILRSRKRTGVRMERGRRWKRENWPTWERAQGVVERGSDGALEWWSQVAMVDGSMEQWINEPMEK